MNELDDVKLHVNETLSSIMERPEMFGDRQAIEMQVITLLEIQYVALGFDVNLVYNAWREFCKKNKCGAYSLSGMTWPISEFTTMLKEFVTLMRR